MPKGPIFEKKNVLVLGGAGFLGSHLCEKLLHDCHVICVDAFIGSSERNIDLLLRNPDFEFIRHDMNVPLELELFKELDRFRVKFQGVQEVYNLACPTSAKNFSKTRIATVTANSLAVKNALDLAVKYNARFVHGSTSVVYGPRTSAHPMFAETDLGVFDHLGPRGCYDEGKRFAETMVQTYADAQNLDAKIARIFRTYGPRQRLFDGEMIPDFAVDALDGRDLVIYGDESFSTSLTFASDMVEGLVKLMAAPAGIGAVNLGSDEEIKLVDVARKVIALTGSTSQIRYEAPLLFITPLGLPDLTKAKERLGWIPLTRLEDGLAKAVDYARANKALIDTMRNSE
jgi:Nucleoside-diphosphate-sugar epimerases